MVSLLAKNRWPFRLHATYDETITRALNVYEEVNREIPLQGLHWFIDHAETISQRNMDRIAALGGGIAIQHRMAFQGEYFRDRYGSADNEANPAYPGDAADWTAGGSRDGRDARRQLQPVCFALLAGDREDGRGLINVRRRDTGSIEWKPSVCGPWEAVGSPRNRDERFDRRRAIADLAVLSADYFSVADDEIKSLESVLTIVGGKPVYAAEEFAELAPPLPPVLPEWSPVAAYGGYHKPATAPAVAHSALEHAHRGEHRCHEREVSGGFGLSLLGVLAASAGLRKEHPSIP